LSRPRELSKLFSTSTAIATDSELASINLSNAINTASAAAVAAANIYTDNATPDLTPAIQSASAAAVAYTNEQISNIDLTPYATTTQLSASVNNIDLSPYATTAQLSASVANIDMGAAIVSASGAAVAELNNRIVISSASPIGNIDGRIWIDPTTASAPIISVLGTSAWRQPFFGRFSATGGVVYDQSSYRYHKFNSSGSFVISSGQKNIEVLTIAGGGAGGYYYGAGGGAGGLSFNIFQNLTPGSYSITVGAGGTSLGGSNYGSGGDGNISQFSSLVTSNGGGGGGGGSS
jgi:hypothetical protein